MSHLKWLFQHPCRKVGCEAGCTLVSLHQCMYRHPGGWLNECKNCTYLFLCYSSNPSMTASITNIGIKTKIDRKIVNLFPGNNVLLFKFIKSHLITEDKQIPMWFCYTVHLKFENRTMCFSILKKHKYTSCFVQCYPEQLYVIGIIFWPT